MSKLTPYDTLLNINLANAMDEPVDKLSDLDSKYISESLDHYPPTSEEMNNAIRTIVSYMRYESAAGIAMNISEIERKLIPKKMTLEEIEKELGHRVELV